jgi:DNA polymerase-3 subunit delta'
MNTESSNAFLKTLEEPPVRTTLLLLTTRPYALLPTIRSRCLNFRFPSAPPTYSPDGWAAWLDDYGAWLASVSRKTPDKRVVADWIMAAYGLIARFGAVLDAATGEIWKQQKEKLPDNLDDDEKTAIETGIANGLRMRLFGEIEQATRAFALPKLQENDAVTNRALSAAIDKLEQSVGLLRLNLNELAALEEFFLTSLRIWTRK